jgi:hypothetical protein
MVQFLPRTARPIIRLVWPFRDWTPGTESWRSRVSDVRRVLGVGLPVVRVADWTKTIGAEAVKRLVYRTRVYRVFLTAHDEQDLTPTKSSSLGL